MLHGKGLWAACRPADLNLATYHHKSAVGGDYHAQMVGLLLDFAALDVNYFEFSH